MKGGKKRRKRKKRERKEGNRRGGKERGKKRGKSIPLVTCRNQSLFIVKLLHLSYQQDQTHFFFFFFLAALGFHCCAWAFSSCGEQGLLFVAVRGLPIAVAFPVEHGL